MPKYSFRDPTTDVLKAWGFTEFNDPVDERREEPDDFTLTPGLWYLPDPEGEWQAYVPTPDPDVNGFILALRAALPRMGWQPSWISGSENVEPRC